MGPAESVTTTENVLRDLVELVLTGCYGDGWLTERVDKERLDRWQERLDEEKARRSTAKVDDRLIYYSDLPDLIKLIRSDWEQFKPCLGNLRTTEFYLKRLIGFRHALSHGRELLQHERDLLAGITGEFRNRVTIFLSEKGPDQEYFPHVEYVQDSFGNVARKSLEKIKTGLTLKPGDEVSFSCRGWDPKGEVLKWNWNVSAGILQLENDVVGDQFTWQIETRDVGLPQAVHIHLLSDREFHRHGFCDDSVTFLYNVVPRDF